MAARIALGVVGAVIGLGLASLAFISGDIMSARFSSAAFAAGLFCTAFGVYFITCAVRPDVLTVDGTGLYLRKTFGSKRIPWAAVRAFRVETAGKGVQVRAMLNTGNKVGMGLIGSGFTRPGAHQIAAELTQALHNHTESAEPSDRQADARTSSGEPGSDSAASPLAGQRTQARKRARNPGAVFLIGLALTLGSVGGLLFTATVVNAAASKSGNTQAHGLLRSGTVTSVTNHETRDPSSDVGVRLEEPVNGRATTTAHVRPITSLKLGAAVQVLVDPQDPGYAEFPGHRYVQNAVAQVAAALFLACIAFFAFVTARWGRVWLRQHRRRRLPSRPQR